MARPRKPRPLGYTQLTRPSRLTNRDSSGRFTNRTGVAISIEAQGLSQFDDRLAALVNVFGARETLETVGALVESQTRRRIEEEKADPATGLAWAEWSPEYAARPHGNPKHKHPNQLREAGRHTILNLDGGLHDSIAFQVSGDEVTIGSNLIYARVHQLGYESIPARPYLGLSDENREEISDVIKDLVSEVFA